MISSVLFSLACPKCDTKIRILRDRLSYACDHCGYLIEFHDPQKLLLRYKEGDLNDLNLEEEAFRRQVNDRVREGLLLKVSALLPDQGKDITGVLGASFADPDEQGKNSHTQVINLSVDPSAMIKQIEAQRNSKGGTISPQRKCVSLKKAIDIGRRAKEPPSTGTTKALIVAGLILGVALCYLFFKAVQS